jgi:FAD/FMN-containing dehydrogenase
LDKSAIDAIQKYKENIRFPPDAEAVLLIEEEGDELRYVEFRLQRIQQVCEENNAFEMHISQSEAENTELWEARSVVGAASSRVKAGYDRIYVGEDITVPIDQLVPMFEKVKELAQTYDLPVVVFGHVGDGNIHPAITVRKSDAEDLARADQLQDAIHKAALDLNGSVTGEHGVGLARKEYLPLERGYAVEIMRKIKQAIDPDNIFNPTKMYPPPE